MTSEKKCLFCKIIHAKIAAAKIWEDSDNIAILDPNPTIHGQTIVMSKSHIDSDVFNEDDKEYEYFMTSVKHVAELLQEKLEVKRVAMVADGMNIDHLYITLYPLHGLGKKFKTITPPNHVFFEKYEGYITTQPGPQIPMDDLQKLAKTLQNPCYWSDSEDDEEEYA
ncbi:MAG: HIT family protein [Candidatus Dependentiae bacterium]|nr:HIT family protein [Candidatus Dependentiae bacterium]